jgi:hypothetical protein
MTGKLSGNPLRMCIVLTARNAAMKEPFPFTLRRKKKWLCLSVRRLPLDRNWANGAREIGLQKWSDGG